MTNLKVLANYYYNLGLNVTHLGFDRTDYNTNDRSSLKHWDAILKSPSHDWEHLKTERQSLSDLNSFDWKNATGVGAVLGYGQLRALDIDECSDLVTLRRMCEILKLPEDYEWIVKSGSGYHIIFFAEEHEYPVELGKVKTFKPNSAYIYVFKHIELRWDGHLVFPPSIHPTFRNYNFLSNIPPYQKPTKVHLNELNDLVENFCDQYNLPESDYQSGVYLDFDNQNDESFVDLDEDFDFFEADEQIKQPSYLFFDTETTGIPKNWDAPISDSDNWPRIVQLAWILYDSDQKLLSSNNMIVFPENFIIPKDASSVHGITTEYARYNGEPLETVLSQFNEDASKAEYLVAHNINYDENVLGAEYYRSELKNPLPDLQQICTMSSSTDYCAIPGNYGYKWPKLDELYFKLFGEYFENAHDALADVEATAKCFWELKKRGVLTEI